VYERKFSRELSDKAKEEVALTKQANKNTQIDGFVTSLTDRVEAIHERKILNQIMNGRIINQYMKKVDDLQINNVYLKSQDDRKKIFTDIRRKENEMKAKKEEDLRRKQLGIL